MPFGISELLVPALLTGGSALAGAFGGKSQTSTSKGTSTPTYTPGQTALQSSAFDQLMKRLNTPTDLTPQKNAVIGNVNSGFDSANTNLQSQLTGRGFGGSGKLGTNLAKQSVARAGAIGGVESQFAGFQQNQDNLNLQQALQFAFANPGNSTTGSSTGPSNVLGGAISGGLDTATTLFSLNHYLNGAGSTPGATTQPLGGG